VKVRIDRNRVHGANKIVKKHERVSLQKEKDAATCDICQENKAVMFCPEDRALICRRCVPAQSATEGTICEDCEYSE
jgi:hypothetical protein